MVTPRPAALRALHFTRFGHLWLAGLVSGLGDKITLVALAYAGWSLTQSTLYTALAVVMATVPNAIFGFFGGAIADAVGRRRVMVACDALRVVFIGAIPAAFALGLPLGVAYGLVFASTTCGAVYRPARLSLVPTLVPAAALSSANALVVGADRIVEIVGALVAGVLVATMQQNAFYVDAVSFGLSALLLSRLRLTEAPPVAVSFGRVWRDASEGVRMLRASIPLWTNTVFSLVAQLALPVANGLLPVLVFRNFMGGPAEFAAVESAMAAGAVGASLVLPSALRRFRKGTVLITGFASYGTMLLLMAMAPSLEILLLVAALSGVANILFYVPNVTIAQEATPPEYRARVFGARIALLNLSWLPVIIFSGAIGDSTGVSLLIGLAGILTLLTATAGALVPSIRDVA